MPFMVEGGRPPAFGKQISLQRHAVECGINLMRSRANSARNLTVAQALLFVGKGCRCRKGCRPFRLLPAEV